MTTQPDPLRDLQAECLRLRQLLADRDERIHDLTEQMRQVKIERDFYSRLYGELLCQHHEAHADEIEAEIVEGMKDGEDFVAGVKELVAVRSRSISERRDTS